LVGESRLRPNGREALMDVVAKRLHKEYRKAQERLEESMASLRTAQAEYDQAKSLFESVETVLALVSGGKLTPTEKRPPVPRRKPTMLDLAEAAILKRGPLTVNELLVELQRHGRETNKRSLSVSLRRERPERFDRDEQGKWFLVTRKGAK